MSKKRYTKKRKGGKAIGSGGFGCIFRPSLQCASSTRSPGKQSKKRVSKLSLKLDVEREMEQLHLVKSYIERIPNHRKYFLLGDIDACQPAPLTQKDKIGFEKCFALNDYNITQQNVNDNLQELMVINMPYGGVTLTNIIEQSKIDYRTINMMLQPLLTKAILPMNALKVYHFDLKADNILYKSSSLKIIDFGEIGISTKTNPIPSILYNRRIQFNSPFSRILFSDIFNSYITTYLRLRGTSKSTPKLYEKLQKVIAVAYEEYKQRYGTGHEQYLGSYILPDILALVGNLVNPEQLLNQMIVNYCTRAVYSFIDFKTKKFDMIRYFKEVYSKNVDIYGWIACYVPFIVKSLADNQYNLSSKDTKITIANVIVQFCFSDKYADKPIPVKMVIDNLNNIK